MEPRRLPGTHQSGLEVLVRQAPLVLVVLVIHQVLLHDLVAGVKEQVADRTGGCVLQVAHWGRGEKRNGKSVVITGHPFFKCSLLKEKVTNEPLLQSLLQRVGSVQPTRITPE